MNNIIKEMVHYPEVLQAFTKKYNNTPLTSNSEYTNFFYRIREYEVYLECTRIISYPFARKCEAISLLPQYMVNALIDEFFEGYGITFFINRHKKDTWWYYELYVNEELRAEGVIRGSSILEDKPCVKFMVRKECLQLIENKSLIQEDRQ